MATSTVLTNKPINPRGDDNRPVDSYNRASLYSGKALDFDGVNDEVNCGDVSDLDFGTGNFSFSLYVKINSAQSSLENIFSKKDQAASTAGYSIFYNHSTGKLLFSNANGTSASEIFSADSFTQYEDQWIHLVAVRDSSDDKNAYFYINAVKHELASPLTIYDTNNSYDFKIGNTHTGTYFNNQQVAGLKAFNVALTAAQVADLYNNPEKVVPTGVDNTALKLWLPMMEGAGTTAYDGSGNGNHGTISGATYVNGVGAPVAQSAVMDWNKGSNFFSISDWEVSNATTNASISSSTQGAPNGIDTAAVFDDGTGSTYKRGYKVSNTAMAIGQITASTFVKKKDVDYINVVLGTDGGAYKFFALVDLVNGTINDTSGSLTATSIQSVGDGWYYVSVEAPHLSTTQGITYIYGQDPTNGSSVDESYTGANNQTYIWGINIQEGAINNVHLPTIGALQSSPVLLPQGLTTGRDITGVNLFENVRKQGALNLDGNSWAEVHDNASLDFGTGSFTLETWARVKYVNQGSAVNAIFTLGGDSASNEAIYINSSPAVKFEYNGDTTGTGTETEGDWVHIVGTYDETNATLYLNGSQNAQTSRPAADVTNALVKQIGRDSTTFRYYNDQIAQPRIYNRALTAEEVQRNYNAGKNIYTN